MTSQHNIVDLTEDEEPAVVPFKQVVPGEPLFYISAQVDWFATLEDANAHKKDILLRALDGSVFYAFLMDSTKSMEGNLWLTPLTEDAIQDDAFKKERLSSVKSDFYNEATGDLKYAISYFMRYFDMKALVPEPDDQSVIFFPESIFSEGLQVFAGRVGKPGDSILFKCQLFAGHRFFRICEMEPKFCKNLTSDVRFISLWGCIVDVFQKRLKCRSRICFQT